MFQKFHMEHHQFQVSLFFRNFILQTSNLFHFYSTLTDKKKKHNYNKGVEGIDVDIPSRWEGAFFTSSFWKAFWVLIQPIFYVTRPFFIKPKAPGKWDLINW